MKLLSSYPTANPSCLYVTAFGGINSILSSSLLVCGSDKSLSFLDLHTGTHLQTTRTITGIYIILSILSIPPLLYSIPYRSLSMSLSMFISISINNDNNNTNNRI